MRLINLNEADDVLDVYHQYKDKVDSGDGMSSDRDIVNGIVDGFMETTTKILDNHRDTVGNSVKVTINDRNRESFTITCTVRDPKGKKTVYTRKLDSVDDLREFNLTDTEKFIDGLKAKRPIPDVLGSIGMKAKK